MLYKSAKEWRNASKKRVLLFGMSGLGKTYISNMLRNSGLWFHYSVDYRIGTRYMGEHIADSFKKEAMQIPYLRDLLLSDSIYIASNITFNNLDPLSKYLGKPGNPKAGGIEINEYERRQEQHRNSEKAALLDTADFINRSQEIYGYDHFVCDSGGSICEVVNPDDSNDPILNHLSQNTLLVWIKGNQAHTKSLIDRFKSAPKPMCYQSKFLMSKWNSYLNENNILSNDVNPNEFAIWAYSQAMEHRQPRYEAMSKWGITVEADEIAKVSTHEEFNTLIEHSLEQTDNTH